MTTTSTDQTSRGGFTRRVPTDQTAAGALTAGELGTASRALGVNVYAAGVDTAHPRHPEAVAWLSFLWERRHTPGVQLAAFTDLPMDDLYHLIGLDDDGPDDTAEPIAPAALDDTDPTAPTPA